MSKNIASLVQIWGPIFFQWDLPLLDARHRRKLSFYAILRKIYHPNSENGEKLHFGPHLGPLGPNSDYHFFSKKSGSLGIIVSYHHVQCHKKLMIQS